MDYADMKLTHGRTVSFRDRRELLILSERKLTLGLLEKIGYYLRYFPEVVYLEDNAGKIIGILTAGDVNRGLALEKIVYNDSFFRLTDLADINVEYMQWFFDSYISIRGIPLIYKGVLQGEFYCHIGNDDPVDRMQWEAISSALERVCREHHIKNVKTPWRDNAVYDQNAFRRKLQDDIKNGNEGEVQAICLQDLYTECLLDYCVDSLKSHGISIYYFEAPAIEKIHKLGDEARRVLNAPDSLEMIADKADVLEEIYHGNESAEYIRTREYENVHYLDGGGYYRLADYQGKYLTIVDGKRLTKYTPDSYRATIHFFGSCIARGHCVSDGYTIESLMQKQLNDVYPGKFRVLNYGVAGRIGNVVNDFHYILNTVFHEGDIVICLARYDTSEVTYLKRLGVACMETSHLFEYPHSYGRWFLDNVMHVNHVGNCVIMEEIYQKLSSEWEKEKGDCPKKVTLKQRKEDEQIVPAELAAYLDDIKKEIAGQFGISWTEKKIGAVVMNCNPFTKGHRYLIEESARKVDILLVFVVQEDRSVFPFADRYRLVKEGMKDLENVLVVPSGNFMISTETFPEYFRKDQLQEVAIDASRDVRIFGGLIAPVLHITRRFVGEEPMDAVTNAYNQSMKEILPEYGVDCEEMPRRQIDGKVVSASYVRELLRERNFMEMEKIVPKVTLDYLKVFCSIDRGDKV